MKNIATTIIFILIPLLGFSQNAHDSYLRLARIYLRPMKLFLFSLVCNSFLNFSFSQTLIEWDNITFAEVIEDNTLRATAWEHKLAATSGFGKDQKIINGEQNTIR